MVKNKSETMLRIAECAVSLYGVVGESARRLGKRRFPPT
jgi:hypothetical protein